MTPSALLSRLRRRRARVAATTGTAGSEQRYRSLFDHNPDGVYSFDLAGHFTSMNAAGAALTGYDDVLGRSFADLVHPDDLPRVLEHFARAVQGESQRYECRVLRADGAVLPLDVTNSAIVVDDEVVGVFGVAKDISARVETERRLELSKQRYKALYHRNPDAVYSLDLQGRFLSGNQACLELTGYEPHVLGSVPFTDLVDEADQEVVQRSFLLAAAGESADYDCTIIRADRRRVSLRILNIPIVIDGEVVGVYGIAKDMTERRRLEVELRRQARSDALTQLPNRVELLEHLADRLEHGDAWLLFIDLDRFKVVNDSLGHEVGDTLLRAVAARLRAALRTSDVLVRFGGDEFCVALTRGTDAEQARAVAERVSEVVRPVLEVAGQELYVTASVGITHGRRGERPDELLRRADIAMYQAKGAGRDQIAVYDGDGVDSARSELSLESELRRALERGELVLHHQPQLRLGESDVVTGVEALVRWQHPQHGLLYPDAFLPVAQRAGLAVALDTWVVEQAVRTAAGWTGAAADLSISVNVCPAALMSPAWAHATEQVLASSGLAPGRLTVEITEGTLIGDPDRVRQVLAVLRERGVQVALDDFGTGWSSLAYLERYPVDELKVDRLFVSRLVDATSAPVVDAVLSLGRALGLRTVAEGVETPEQRDRLRAAGCDAYQGYLVSRPLPEAELLQLVAELSLPAQRTSSEGRQALPASGPR